MIKKMEKVFTNISEKIKLNKLKAYGKMIKMFNGYIDDFNCYYKI